MKIAIIGSGYVGLVSGVCLAEIGHHVICVDNNPDKIRTLKKGKLPIYEPGLLALMKTNVAKKRLSFTGSIGEATRKSQVIFLAVPTPPKTNGDADLVYIENVARQIAQHMDSYKLIVEKSTVPAETGKKIRRTIHLNLPKKYKNGNKILLDFDVASNPEFLKEGSAVHDFMNPDRVVIGVESKKAEQLLKEIYKPLKAKVLVTNIASAEMIKHASNSFLAAKISFINAVAQICDRVGADVLKVAEGMGLDKRIGRQFLDAGVGYGGSCFPKDVDAFIRLGEKSGYDFPLLKEVRRINNDQRHWFVRLVEEKLWNIKDKTIGVWGLAFKPNTDDLRSAAALEIIELLQAEGARVRVYDPKAMEGARKILGKAVFCDSAYAVAEGCDCLLLLTEWPEFKDIDFVQVRDAMRQTVIFDGRNFLDGAHLRDIGFEYFGVGRGRGV
ncbi:MAG: UDP-glucose/GDP-mannose dehydrogenase family protein [Candidatus Omnitrophica bacterium]|nr:UDP-glucose/GDP-mannose dehydrogenase family protein [Candidatus Omnitrophota bacterium]MDE2010197.1 UDP-glucose/GDP-mannose dehydrogenase family protein [Candidatus Omnitrophota bacterium]MDE2215085.1 UDP-glucose/GDP-mannose dehydrogenase family protein [Candidatus Omnitrophota bacterium]MDE2232403.1 UDP-glucose/GDP-mannose dehydrogenase family protein [Candidatus Omnitrophota bacterium]